MGPDSFKNPEPVYRGTDFWMLNGKLCDEEIAFQMEEMHKQGIHSFIARTYIGLQSDYPGREFKKQLRCIIDTAKIYGMKVYLQAGYMPEAVPDLPEEYSMHYIVPRKEGCLRQDSIVFTRHNGYVYTDVRADDLLNMFDKEVVDGYLKATYEDVWQEFSDEWGGTIESIWVDEPSYRADYLPWPPNLADEFIRKYGYDIREKIYLLYVNEDGYEKVRYDYRTLMRDLMEENYFKNLSTWCKERNLKASGHLMMEDTLRQQILRAGAIMPYYKYFDIPGMDVLNCRMEWKDAPIHPDDELKMRSALYQTTLQCVSAAYQAGKKHILCEMYACTSENMNFRNMLYMFDEYAAMGINHRCVHGVFYSLKGQRKRAYPPHIHYYQPYWEKYSLVNEYCARVSAFISNGRPAAKTLILHPLETAYTIYKGDLEGGQNPGKDMYAYDRVIYKMLHILKSSQLDVHYGDFKTIADTAYVKDGLLYVGDMCYDTVVLPCLDVLSSEVMDILRRFASENGKIIIYKKAPGLLDGTKNPSVEKELLDMHTSVFAEDLPALVREIEKKREYTLEGAESADILVNHRRGEESDYYMLFNTSCMKRADIVLRTKGDFNVKIYDAIRGTVSDFASVSESGTTLAEISIDAGSSVLLEFARDAKYVKNSKNITSSVVKFPETTPWEIVGREDNCAVLEYCSYKKESGEFSGEILVLAVNELLKREGYCGKITLRYKITAENDFQELYLVTEYTDGVEFYVNSEKIDVKECGYFLSKDFKKLILTDKIKKGENYIDVCLTYIPLSKTKSALTSLFEEQKGSELENMYIVGDFYVNAYADTCQNGDILINQNYTIAEMPEKLYTYKELTVSGFPFYSGSITLEKKFCTAKPGKGEKCILRINTLNAGVGEVYINGTTVGAILRTPFECDITELVKDGENIMAIRLLSTIRNTIGPFHNPRGDVGNLFGGAYENPHKSWMDTDMSKPGWEYELEYHNPKWTNDYFLAPFGVGDITISRNKEEI